MKPKDDTNYPSGSIQGLCSSSATCFAASIAFLGYWGFQISDPWKTIHLLVLVPLIFAAIFFGLTPFFATCKKEAPEYLSRYSYLIGLIFLLFSVLAALGISYFYHKTIP